VFPGRNRPSEVETFSELPIRTLPEMPIIGCTSRKTVLNAGPRH
jgi:hypothetical protein